MSELSAIARRAKAEAPSGTTPAPPRISLTLIRGATSSGFDRLRDHSLLEDLPKIRCQAAVIAGQHLVKGLLGLIGCCPRLLFAARGFRLVLLHLGLELCHHHRRYSPPRARLGS